MKFKGLNLFMSLVRALTFNFFIIHEIHKVILDLIFSFDTMCVIFLELLITKSFLLENNVIEKY